MENGQMIKGLAQIQDKVHETTEQIKNEASDAKSVLEDIGKGLTTVFGGMAIKGFIDQMMQVRGQFQQTEMAFETMLGSKQKADDLMKQMIQTAATTPFGVTDVTDGAKQLLAFNVSAEEVNDTLIRLGDVAAGMGLRMSDIVMLYGTTIAKGKMDTQDLYQHLNRGIPIAESLAKVMGLDVNNAISEVGKAIKAHKVDSDTYIAAIRQMTSEGSKFGGLMAAQSTTITGRIETIKDGVEQMFNEIGKSQEGITGVGLDFAGELVNNWRTIGKVIMPVIVAYGTFKAAQLAVIAVTKAWKALQLAGDFLITAKRIIGMAQAYGVAATAARTFNAAMTANVIGAVIAVVATAITMFKSFGDEMTDTASMAKKFGAEANEAASNVESLVQILKASDDSSKVCKDTIAELREVYEDYGIKLTEINDTESNLIDVKQEAIDKSNELIEAIRTESIERQRANAIAAAGETFKGVSEGAVKDLSDDLDDFGSNKEAAKMAIQTAFSDDELRNIAKAKSALEALGNGLNRTAEQQRQLGAAYNAFTNACESSEAKLRAVADKLGLNENQTNDLIVASKKYAVTMGNGLIVLDNSNAKINTAANSMENLSDSTEGADTRLKAIQNQLQGATDNVHTLYQNVQNLMETYAFNDIRFRVSFTADLPQWMLQKDIPELEQLAKYFTAKAKDNADNGRTGTYIAGKYYSTEDMAQRGADYARAANQKQTKKEEEEKAKRKAQQEAEATKKKREAEAKKKAAEAKRAAQDAAKRREQLAEEERRWNEQQEKTAQEASNATADLEVSRIKNENKKKREENRREHEKNLQQIEEQADAYRKTIYEHNKKIWEINNTDKTTSYEDTSAGKAGWKGISLSKDQQANINAAKEKENLDYQKKQADIDREILESELTAMREYIDKYGTLQEQKLALDSEYADKRRQILESSDTDTSKQWQLRSLDAQHSADTSKMNFDIFKNTIDWDGLFSDMTALTKAQLEGVKKKLVDLMQSGTLQLEDYKTVLQQIEQLSEAIADSGSASPWKTERSKKRELLEQNVVDAKQAYASATNEQAFAGLGLSYQQDTIMSLLKGMGINVDKGNVTTQNASNVIGAVSNKYGSDSPQTKAVQEAFAKLAGSSNKVSQANEKVSITASKLTLSEQKLQKFLNDLPDSMRSFIETFGKVAANFQDLPGLLGELGLHGDSDTMKGAEDLANAANSSMNAVKDFASGNYVGAAMNGVSAIKSLGSGLNNVLGLGIGKGNSAEINEKIEDLTERNDLLIKALDRLTEKLDDTTGGIGSVNAAKEALQTQKELEDNYKEIANLRSIYTAAHHSWAYSFNKAGGWTAEELAAIRKKIGRSDWGGDLNDLTTDEIADVLAMPDIVEKIKNTGNSLYANTYLEYLQQWAGQAGKLEDIQDTLSEKLTQTTFDGLRSDFLSTLMDMESEAEDFSDKFTELLQQSVLNSMISDLLDDELQQLYDDWSKAAESGLTQADIERLSSAYDAIVEKGLELRDQASKITGYEGSDSDADSSTGAWSSLGEEAGRALEGRFAALQIQVTKIADTLAASVAQNLTIMQSIAATGIANSETTQDIRNMMVMTNSYLEDIVKYNKGIYQEFGKKLDNIKTNTDKL